MIVDTERDDVLLIEKFEGFRGDPYLCSAGVPTIGLGNTRYLNGSKVKIGDRGVVKEEARFISVLTLDKDFYPIIDKYVKIKLNNNQRMALVSFVYNVGETNFKRSTLLKKLNAGDIEGASNEFLKWNKAGGNVLKGLTRRRVDERALFLKSEKESAENAHSKTSFIDLVISLFANKKG